MWHHKGKRGDVLPERRLRTLLRRADVPLVVWQSFEIETFVDPVEKAAAVDALHASAARSDDVVAREWKTDDGRLLLMLEHFC